MTPRMPKPLCLAVIAAIFASHASAEPISEVAKRFDALTHSYTGGDYQDEVFKYRLLKPDHIEPGKTYSLVLFLHGAGERGDDNQNQLKYLPSILSEPAMRKRYPCFVLAPQCRRGKRWVEVDWGAKTSTPMTEPSDMMNVAIAVLTKTLADQPVDRTRIYLTGLSMGGYGAWDLACRHPKWFAAVVPICGGGDERQAKRLVGLPVWAWHGDKDRAVPTVRSRIMIEHIKKAGGSPKYTELAGVGHNAWTPAYTRDDGVLPWLFEQVRR